MIYTYFIANGNYVKIGKSINPYNRYAKIQSLHAQKLVLLLVIEGDHEKLLHIKFAEYRKTGEWFFLSAKIRSFIVAHPQFDPSLIQRKRLAPKLTRMKYERNSRRLSQTVLAASAGLHQGEVSQIERGVLVPTPQQLVKLAAAFDLPADDLLKEVIVVERSA